MPEERREERRGSSQRLPLTPETQATLADLTTGVVGSILIGLVVVIAKLLA